MLQVLAAWSLFLNGTIDSIHFALWQWLLSFASS
ncbi:hypothetical protein QFZ72_003028 [Bacillus sp. V2I10]|nr:hypothetical protein [Bacillus sp. V2I10]